MNKLKVTTIPYRGPRNQWVFDRREMTLQHNRLFDQGDQETSDFASNRIMRIRFIIIILMYQDLTTHYDVMVYFRRS